MDTTKQAATPNPSPEVQALLAQLAEMQAKLDAKPRNPVQALTIKVSEKGCLSVYGLGRFPVSLYLSQWERLSSEMARIMAFGKANAGKLATKS